MLSLPLPFGSLTSLSPSAHIFRMFSTREGCLFNTFKSLQRFLLSLKLLIYFTLLYFTLASQLLREAEKLIEQKIHPQIIVAGWHRATDVAHEALKSAAINNSLSGAKFREDLLNIASTTLSSKILSQHKDHFSKLAVDAVLRLKGSGNLNAIQVLKIKGGVLEDSFLDEGFLLDKKVGLHQPKRLENAKILIANTPMDTDKIKVFGSKIQVDSMAKVAELESAEKEKMKDKISKILKHDANVFVNRLY